MTRSQWAVVIVGLGLLGFVAIKYWRERRRHAPAPLEPQLERLGSPGRFIARGRLRWIYEPYLTFSGWRWFIPLCLFVLIAAGSIMRELDALLRAMHVPGAAALSMTDLVGMRSLWLGSSHSATVLGTWADWFNDTSMQTGRVAVVDPKSLAWLWLLTDSVFFVFAYTSLLGVLLVRAGARLAQGQGPSEANRRDAYRRLVAAAFVGVPVLAVSDELENLFSALIVSHPSDARFWAFWCFAAAKWILGFLIALPLLAAWISIGSARTAGLHRFGSALVACRVQILLVSAFVLLLLGPPQVSGQAADVLRRWVDDWWWTAPLPVATTLVLGLVILLTGRWLIDRVDDLEPGRNVGKRWLLIVILVSLAFGILVLGLQVWGVFHGGWGLYVAAAIAFVIALLSLPISSVETESSPAAPSAAVVPLLAAVPPVALGVAAIRGGAGEYFYSHNRGAIALIGIGLLLQLAGWALFFVGVGKEDWFVAKTDDDPPETNLRPAWKAFLGVVALVAVVVGVIVAANPWAFVRGLNTVGYFVAFMVLALVVGFGLVLLAEIVPPPGVFLVFRLRRIPILTLVLVWLVAASVADTKGAFHDVRTSGGHETRPLTLTNAFNGWLERQSLPPFDEASATSSADKTKAIPLIFVSAAGGGIRAAFWTSVVLDCVLEGQGPRCDEVGGESGSSELFAESGISGGSLGLIAYGAHRLHPERANGEWADRRLGGDYAAPTIAAMFFRDAPNAFLRLNDWDDRAAVLERSWERSWSDTNALGEGFLADEESGRLPLLLLNGTSVKDGCRFNTSLLVSEIRSARAADEPRVEDCLSLRPFERDPPKGCELPGRSDCRFVRPEGRQDWVFGATKDLTNALCSRQTMRGRVVTDDVKLSTAALLSARFPFVSPSARVTCEDGSSTPTSYVVDGGYFDTSGASTIVELWQALQPTVAKYNRQANSDTCVVPVFVQIDNTYSEPSGPKPGARPSELLVPPSTYNRVRDGREANAREMAALEFSGPLAANEEAHDSTGKLADRFAHLFPRAHPGTQAPLGWTLSKASEKDLHNQLTNKSNHEEIEKARTWFGPNAFSCQIDGPDSK